MPSSNARDSSNLRNYNLTSDLSSFTLKIIQLYFYIKFTADLTELLDIYMEYLTIIIFEKNLWINVTYPQLKLNVCLTWS